MVGNLEIDERILALADISPKLCKAKEVRYLVELIKALRQEVEIYGHGEGRIHGLLEAVGMLREASNRVQKVSIMYGKKQQSIQSINCQILERAAAQVEAYANALASKNVLLASKENLEALEAHAREKGQVVKLGEDGQQHDQGVETTSPGAGAQ